MCICECSKATRTEEAAPVTSSCLCSLYLVKQLLALHCLSLLTSNEPQPLSWKKPLSCWLSSQLPTQTAAMGSAPSAGEIELSKGANGPPA